MDAPRHWVSRSKNLVVFLVGKVHYAVDILRVREIIQPLPLVALPQSTAATIGVADYRGEVLPVMDLRLRFGLIDAPQHRRLKWIIVDSGGQTTGLVVDTVADVFGATDAQLRPLPGGRSTVPSGVSAVYAYNRSLVFCLDIDQVVDETDEMAFTGLQRLTSGDEL